MRKLLSRERLRHLQLIEWLYFTSEPLSLAQLSSELNCSQRTLARDIKYINLMYAPLKITTTPQGKQLDTPPHISLDFAISRTLTLSPTHSFLELMFFRRDYIAEELAAKLFISLSSLKRLIYELQQNLAPYDIQIKSRPYRLVGNEQHIQHLYLYLLKNKYPNYHKLFTPEQFKLANQLLTHLHTAFATQKRLPCLNNFFYLLLTSVTHHSAPSSFPTNNNLSGSLLALTKVDPDYSKGFQEQFQLPFNQTFAKRLVGNLLFFEDASYAAGFPDITPEALLLKSQLKDLLTELSRQFFYDFSEQPLLYQNLVHLILLKHSLPKQQPLVPLIITDDGFQQFSFFLRQVLSRPAFNELALYHEQLEQIFEIYWPTLNLTVTENLCCLTIGIIATAALPETIYFKNRLAHFLGNHYKLVMIDEAALQPVNLATFDLLISPCSRQDLRQPHLISLNFFPSYHEWQALAKLIFQIKTSKNMT